MTLSNNACCHIDDPSAISRTHMVKGKTQLVPRPPHMTVACILPSLKHIEKKLVSVPQKRGRKEREETNMLIDMKTTGEVGHVSLVSISKTKQTNRIEK